MAAPDLPILVSNSNGSFKARVALEICKWQKTVNQVSTEYKVHPNVIVKWKKQMLKELPEIFSKEKRGQNKAKEDGEIISKLYQKIGELGVELEWLKKKSTILS